MSNIDEKVLLWIEQPIDLHRLLKRLSFQADGLEEAALRQPKLQSDVGRLRAQIFIRKSSLKRRLARTRAKKGLKIRHRESGLTETFIKSQLDLDPDVERMQKKLDYAEAYELAVDDLREAYKERNMIIGFLTRLRSAEMNNDLRSVEGEREVDKMRKRARKARKRFQELEDRDDF